MSSKLFLNLSPRKITDLLGTMRRKMWEIYTQKGVFASDVFRREYKKKCFDIKPVLEIKIGLLDFIYIHQQEFIYH